MRLGARDVERVAAAVRNRVEPDGSAGPELAAELRELEGRPASERAQRLLQDLFARLGVETSHPIALPLEDTPYWLRGEHPLAEFRSRPTLEGAVDVLVIGAGLTGASAAYHLAGRGLRVALVDAGDPAGEASGRNAAQSIARRGAVEDL